MHWGRHVRDEMDLKLQNLGDNESTGPQWGVYVHPVLAIDPERRGGHRFGGHSYRYLTPFEEPSSGQIELVRPIPVPDDERLSRIQEGDLNWLRQQMQDLILTGDWRALKEQEGEFAYFTVKLMSQRGFRPCLTEPRAWHRRFATRTVIETAEQLYERCRDVRLRIDMATAEFELCGAKSKVRHRSDEVIVSLRPVVDALLMTGLWVDQLDARFRELAGLVVRLAQGGYRHVGRPECMVKRCGRGER